MTKTDYPPTEQRDKCKRQLQVCRMTSQFQHNAVVQTRYTIHALHFTKVASRTPTADNPTRVLHLIIIMEQSTPGECHKGMSYNRSTRLVV